MLLLFILFSIRIVIIVLSAEFLFLNDLTIVISLPKFIDTTTFVSTLYLRNYNKIWLKKFTVRIYLVINSLGSRYSSNVYNTVIMFDIIYVILIDIWGAKSYYIFIF